jgi:hypothetical protein
MPLPDSVWHFFATKKPDRMPGFFDQHMLGTWEFSIPGYAANRHGHVAPFSARAHKNVS